MSDKDSPFSDDLPDSGISPEEHPEDRPEGRRYAASSTVFAELYAASIDRLNRGETIDYDAILESYPDVGRELVSRIKAFAGISSMPPSALASTTLGDYQLIRQIGRGGMGVVYEAWENSMNRAVALKVIPSAVAADTKTVSRFVREAQVAGKLHHPHIVSVYAMGVKDESPYYAMELVEGETLAQMLARLKDAEPDTETPFGRRDELAFYSNLAVAFADVAEGLQHAHSKGVIHRDIKPSNLILDVERKLRILDFGLAHLEGQESLTMSGDLLGTVLYMSPEQAMAKRVPLDHRTDVYSLGATMYETLTGEPPFRGKDQHATLSSIIVRDPRPPRQLNPQVPRDIETIVLKCLMKDPGDRYGTAEALGQDLRRFVRADPIEAKPLSALSRIARRAWRHRWKFAIAVTFVVLLSVLVGYVVRADRREQSLRELPKIEALWDEGKGEAAWKLAGEAKEVLGNDMTLAELIRDMTTTANISTDLPGARLYYKPYGRPEDEWTFLDKTPVNETRVPKFLCRWRVEIEGFRKLEFILDHKYVGNLQIGLQAATETPPGMVYVAGGRNRSIQLGMLYHHRVPQRDLPNFYIDKYEVTNREFKAFVDDGGYAEPSFWEDAFEECGVEEAEKVMGRFRDATDRPGPAEWRDGAYNAGRDDYPVAGVSWFEAAAYAKYRKKRLPSVDLWAAAATPYHSAEMLPLSNIETETEPARVGKYNGISGWGAYDMAGNVREWCWNDSGRGRFLLGGASRDPGAMFTYPNARDPFERSADTGFRCVQLIDGARPTDSLWAPVDLREHMRDYSVAPPMSDEEYRSVEADYSYDANLDLLDARHDVEPVEEEYWIRERISFRAVYPGGERVPVVMFIPRGFEPPFKTILICPTASAWQPGDSRDGKLADMKSVRFIVQSGRVVIYPISQQTFERCTNPYYKWSLNEQRDVHHAMLMDYSRTIDYLETRDEFDTKNLGFYGNSSGAYLGPLLLALEPRFQAAVLKDGGLPPWEEHRTIDKLYFAPRVKLPVLMLNGEWDFVFPYKESQLPLFRLLGTPDAHKRHLRYEVVHGVPWNAVKHESLDWFDKYLGKPVRKAETEGAIVPGE